MIFKCEREQEARTRKTMLIIKAQLKKDEEKGGERTSMALGLPIAQRLTLWSSPPVTRTLDDLRPILRQLTEEACATNSSGHNSSRPSQPASTNHNPHIQQKNNKAKWATDSREI